MLAGDQGRDRRRFPARSSVCRARMSGSNGIPPWPHCTGFTASVKRQRRSLAIGEQRAGLVLPQHVQRIDRQLLPRARDAGRVRRTSGNGLRSAGGCDTTCASRPSSSMLLMW